MIWSFVGFSMMVSGFCLIVCAISIRQLYILRKSRKKLNSYIEALKEEALHLPTKEISELHFRDKNGNLCQVRIVIDHSLQDYNESEPVNKIIVGRGQVQEFIFSPLAVQQMRARGHEPDEVVTQILRSSGRIT